MVNRCLSLVNGMSMTQHQLRDSQSYSTRLGMRKSQVESRSLQQGIALDSSLAMLVLHLESLSLKNGFAACNLLKQNKRGGSCLVRAMNGEYDLCTPGPSI